MQNAKYIDLTNRKIGKLYIVRKGNGRYTKGGQYKATWICQCECGNIKEIDGEKLRRGSTVSCGCVRKEKIGNVNFNDITGQKFGMLTVVKFLEPSERENKNRSWLCKCDCGNYTQVNVSKLKNGHTQSCGCKVIAHISQVNRKYEHISKRLYSVYREMISRCTNPESHEYHNYGGRGISVCDEWSGEFGYDSFSKWALLNGYDEMAERGQCTLDRIDVDKNYEPSNCRWVSNDVQQNNRRDCIYVEYEGRKLTLAQCSREFDIPYTKLAWRIKKGIKLQNIIKEFKGN